MKSIKLFLKGSLLGKIVATILAFVPFANLIPTWFATEMLFKGWMRIALFIVFIIFWIPGMIASLWWIWIA